MAIDFARSLRAVLTKRGLRVLKVVSLHWGGKPVRGLIRGQKIAPVVVAAVGMFLSGCSNLDLLKGADGAADAKGEIPWTRGVDAELLAENANLKSENKRLRRELAELQTKGQGPLSAALTAPAEVPPSPPPAAVPTTAASEPPAATVAISPPPPGPPADAVVEPAKADVALADAPNPAGGSPRLVQPTFADERPVFENEASRAGEGALSILFGVHLASYRGIDEARDGWRTLQRENPEELGLLEPRIERIEVPGRGEFLRLVGGGFASQDMAGALCQRLRARGVFCSTAAFSGERLTFAEARG